MLIQHPHSPLRERHWQRRLTAAPARWAPVRALRRRPDRTPACRPSWASSSIVGCSKIWRKGNSTRRVERIRETICVASSECPPRSKKFARMPKPDLPSTSLQMSSKVDSIGDRGASRSSVDTVDCLGWAGGGDRASRWPGAAAPAGTRRRPGSCSRAASSSRPRAGPCIGRPLRGRRTRPAPCGPGRGRASTTALICT